MGAFAFCIIHNRGCRRALVKVRQSHIRSWRLGTAAEKVVEA